MCVHQFNTLIIRFVSLFCYEMLKGNLVILESVFTSLLRIINFINSLHHVYIFMYIFVYMNISDIVSIILYLPNPINTGVCS